MATTTETVFVEFVLTGDKEIESTQKALERTGKVDKAMADEFRKTNAELAKRQKIIDNLNKELQETQSQHAKTIAELEVKMQNFFTDFVAGMQEGVVDALKEAGFEFDEFGNIIRGNTNEAIAGIDGLNKKIRETKNQSPYDKLNKQLSDARDRVLNLSASLNQLSRTGGGGSELFKKQAAELEKAKAELQKFQQQYEEVNSVIEKGRKPLDDTEKSQNVLKKRLGEIKTRLLELTVANQEGTEEFRNLTDEAGNLTDALGKVNTQIKNAANSERALTGTLQLLSGIAGGFALVTSAQAIFGSENEDLNEVLLEVNSAMAALQGIEAVIAITKQESAAATLLQTVAQKAYNVVVGESIGLLKGLRIALAATGIGLAILALAALVIHLQKAGKATKELTQDFTAFNNATVIHIEEVNRALAQNQRFLEENQARARARGAVQSDLAKQEITDLRGTFQAIFQLEQAQRDRATTARQMLDEIASGERAHNKDLEGELQKTVDNYESTKNRRLDIANEIRNKEIENAKQIRVEQLQAVADTINGRLALAEKNSKQQFALAKEAARAEAAVELEAAGENVGKMFLIEKQLQERLREIDREAARVRQEDRVAAAENALLAVQQKSQEINNRVSQDEIDAQKRVIAENARLSLLQEGLSANQRLGIIKKSLAEQAKLQKEFNQQSTEDSLNDLVARNNAELANLNLNNGERLRLQEENLIAQAQIEIEKNKGLADQIKAIRAKLNEDLRALRLASIEKTLANELSLEQSRTGALRRANERIVSDERNNLSKRIAAVNQLASLDIAAINKKDDALEKSFRDNLISQEEYNRRHAELVDEELKVEENAELTKRRLRFETTQAAIQFAIDTASQIAAVIQQFGQNQTEREQQRIDEQKEEIQALREAGAITEKEAAARQKKLENEEKQIKRRQAERDKAIAIFQAIINTASAVTRALATGGPVLAAIVAAIGAAQVAAIANRPIPRFGKGKSKHNTYEGPAEIGETGPELMESNGRMFLAKKRTLVWVGRKDRVFNPQETVAMLEKNNMRPYVVKDSDTKEYKSIYQSNIDYDKLGKVISSNLPQVALDINEHGFSRRVAYNNAMDRYLDERRSYK